MAKKENIKQTANKKSKKTKNLPNKTSNKKTTKNIDKKPEKKIKFSKEFCKKYGIRTVVLTLILLLIGLINCTDHMISKGRGFPFEWIYYNSIDIHINLLRFIVDFGIISIVAIVLLIIWSFTKANIGAKYEIRRKEDK